MKPCLLLPGLLIAATALAEPPTAQSPFHIRQANSANSGNHATGDILVWGIQNVQAPIDAPGAYVYGVSGICPTGQVCGAYSTDPDWRWQGLFERDWTLLPHQYYASTPYNATLTGKRHLILSTDASYLGSNTLIAQTPSVGSAGAMPFVASMTVSGSGLTPSISWVLPGNTPDGIDTMRIRVQDNDHRVTVESRHGTPRSFQQSDLIWQSPVLASTNLTLPTGVLSYGTSYSISIDLAHTRADGSIASRSSSYFDFTPIDPATLPAGVSNIALPTLKPVPTTDGLLAGPVYGFNVGDVGPDHITFIDPVVATGFSYATGAGDPNFKLVQVASDVGDGLYEVWTWDGGAWQRSAVSLAAGTSFDFTANGFAGGVDRFQIRGIEASANVNAFDVTGFVTGLSFVAEGSFTGTMQAITTAVPEPATYWLWLAGAGALLARRRRQA